ncbi:MAG: hypothetical protein U1F00_15725 [Rhodoferax sp.]
MQIFRISITLMAVTLAISAHAQSQTPWPDFMPRLVHAPADSPVAAKMPDDVAISVPDTSLPAEKAAWSGRWSGFACQRRACDIGLAVEKVDQSGASIVYAFGQRGGAVAERLEAKFENGELRGILKNGYTVAYRMRSTGEIEMYQQSADKKDWSAGIMRKAK